MKKKLLVLVTPLLAMSLVACEGVLPIPSAWPSPSETPSVQPTVQPSSATPTQTPSSAAPTQAPSSERPSTQPTQVPSSATPTQAPSSERPTQVPSSERPTQVPSSERPTETPSSAKPSSGSQVAPYNLQLLFYIDYNHYDVDEPYLSVWWWYDVPFTKEEIGLVDPEPYDPYYGRFAGWSKYALVDELDRLLNFGVDSFSESEAAGGYMNIYGIFISQ